MTGNFRSDNSNFRSPTCGTIYKFIDKTMHHDINNADRKASRNIFRSHSHSTSSERRSPKLKSSYSKPSQRYQQKRCHHSNKHKNSSVMTSSSNSTVSYVNSDYDNLSYDGEDQEHTSTSSSAIATASTVVEAFSQLSPISSSSTLSSSIQQETIFRGIQNAICSRHPVSLLNERCVSRSNSSSKRTLEDIDIAVATSPRKSKRIRNETSLSCTRSSCGSRGGDDAHNRDHSDRLFSDLPLEWWERSDNCKQAKTNHVAKIDKLCESREYLVLNTTLWEQDIMLEPNMFPYDTPLGIEHYTLWSKDDLAHEEIVRFVDDWIAKRFPRVRRWQYDDNSGERSILLFHVHVFIEMDPYSFSPRPGLEYFPPHCFKNYKK